MTRTSVTDDQYGKLWRRLKEIARRVEEGTLEFPETMTDLQNVIEGTVRRSADGTVRVAVDFNQLTSKMIRAGKFDWTDEHILEGHLDSTRRFNGMAEMRVFSIKDLVGKMCSMNSKEVISALSRIGYYSAEFAELLAFAAKYPDEQRRYTIVGLGSLWGDWNSYRDVLCLDALGGLRSLRLMDFAGNWPSDYRFLAVRKESSEVVRIGSSSSPRRLL